jgi:hypothetical protein
MINTELNYLIYDKEMLTIVSGFQHWYTYLERLSETIQVVSDYKTLEYFMTTKALTACQACWAEVLSQFNFQIMYKPGALNQADTLTRREQDLDNLTAAKTTLQTQVLLKPEQLDPQIQAKLLTGIELCSIDTLDLDFINEILQANCISLAL